MTLEELMWERWEKTTRSPEDQLFDVRRLRQDEIIGALKQAKAKKYTYIDTLEYLGALEALIDRLE